MTDTTTSINTTTIEEESSDMKNNNYFQLKRYFTKEGIHPFDEVEWITSKVQIQDTSGKILFDHDVEHPSFWNYMSVRTCADKYFKTKDLENHPKGGERSIKDVIHRVAYGISHRAQKAEYVDDNGKDVLYNELCHILLHQYAAFNSPTFFNMGLFDVYGFKGNSKSKRYAIKNRDGEVYEQSFEYENPQTGACKSGDTWIYTNQGPMYLEDLVNNFSSLNNIKVLTSKGFSDVKAAKFNGIKDTYKITFRDGNELRITEDDEIFANFNYKDKKFRTISSLINDENENKYNSDGYRAHTKLINNYLFENNINNLSIAKSAICGWIQTDGFYGPSGNSTCLDLLTQFDEEEEIPSYLKEIYPDKHIKSIFRKNIQDESLKLKSHRIYGYFLKEIWEDEYDLISLECPVPKKIKFGKYEEVIAYLRSIFQAEGSVSFRGNTVAIQCGIVNKELAYDIFHMLRSLGIFSRIKKKVDKRDNRRNAYCISINNYSECEKFYNIIGFIGERKNSKLDLYLNKLKGKGKTKKVEDFWSSIKSIEYYGKEKVYDIETEVHDFYANGILVHNCYITEVDDELVNGEIGIYDWINTEMTIFSNGSGSGVNVSKIRGAGETITGGGTSSGVLSFLKVADTSASAIKSGGKTRRAAKLLVLDDNHPDLLEFIDWKKNEEFKARSLILNGFDSSWNSNDGVYSTVQGQNANNSISVTDKFMQSVIDNEKWELKYVLDNKVKKTIPANEIFDKIVDAAWECGDPGLFYYDEVNRWHTVPNSGNIRAANPCVEFLNLDANSCTLASLNLLKFLNKDKTFNLETYTAVIEIMIFSMEIEVAVSSFPSRRIAEVTKNTRPLGLGYCNMGGLIMMLGYPYDSDQARSIISSVTSLMSAIAYSQSAKIASVIGPFKEFNKNKKEFINVIKKHQEHNDNLKPRFKFVKQIHSCAVEYWKEAVNLISKHGARNSQVVVIAPTGCLTGDTMILSSEGLLPISYFGDVDGSQWQDTNFNIIQENDVEHADKFYVNGRDRVYKLVTERGHEIKATHKHKIRVVNESGEYIWKRMEDIKPGDYTVLGLGGHEELLGNKELVELETQYRTSSLRKEIELPSVLDESTSEFIGYYMGDGCADKQGGIKLCIYNADNDLENYFIDYLSNNLKIGGSFEERRGCNVLHAYSVDLYDWFRNNNFLKHQGNNGEGSEGAFIPEQILRSKTSVLQSFLRGLFEADGCIYVSKTGYPSVEFSTVSEQLARGVHTALESLGILSKLHTNNYERLGNKTQYRIRILNVDSVRMFKEQIGFISNRKNNLLNEGISKDPTYKEKRGFSISHKGLISDLCNEARKTDTRLAANIATRVRQNKISLYYVREILNNYPQFRNCTKLGQILSRGNLQIVPVESCEYIGYHSTYDISVPNRNTYRANGFISHNTIMFLMGTTNNGIEPAFSLTSWKLMSDGSSVQLLCEEVEYALRELGYNNKQVKDIFDYVKEHGHVERAPHLNPRHLPIFDTANVNGNGTRYIKPMAHVEAVAAATPFVSGGISKTINLPNSATREDFKNCYIEGWKLGCKALSLYRDGSKWSQPLNSNNNISQKDMINNEVERTRNRIQESKYSHSNIWDFHRGLNTRKKAGNRAPSERLNFNLGNENIHYNVVRYPNNGISEVWIEVGKENPTVNGLSDTIGRLISVAIQHGVPIRDICETLEGLQFNPAGFLGSNELNIKSAKSISDLTSKVIYYLNNEYLSNQQNDDNNNIVIDNYVEEEYFENDDEIYSGIECERCGSKRTKGTVKCGVCLECGTTYGSCS